MMQTFMAQQISLVSFSEAIFSKYSDSLIFSIFRTSWSTRTSDSRPLLLRGLVAYERRGFLSSDDTLSSECSYSCS